MSEDYVIPKRVTASVKYASFGRVTDFDIGGYHAAWNEMRRRAEIPECIFSEKKSNSGCRMPMCPKCGPRMRYRFCMAILAHAYRRPHASLSVVSYSVTSLSPYEFTFAFSPQAQRKCKARKREDAISIGYITNLGMTKGVLLDDEEGEAEQTWNHNRIAVLIHGDKSPMKHRHSNVDGGGILAHVGHIYDDEIRANGQVYRQWLKGSNAEVIIGEVLRQMSTLTYAYFGNRDEIIEFLPALHNEKLKYYRTNQVS